jgi:sugar/nucleoside kinase (ribokinase family)
MSIIHGPHLGPGEKEKTSTDAGSVAGIGQPLLDIIVPCKESLLATNGFTAGTHEFMTTEEIARLLSQVPVEQQHLFTGGSALNSIKSARTLGSGGAYYGLTGNDTAGQRVRDLFLGEDIVAPIQATEKLATGVCVSLITPNGERTMRTNLGASALLDAEHVRSHTFGEYAWVILEGYLLVSSANNRAALFTAVSALKDQREKVVFCLASEYVASTERDVIRESILPHTGLLIANEREACALTNNSCANDALFILEKELPGVVITCGERGAWTYLHGKHFFTPAHPTAGAVVDTTGAGDVYLGAFLAGLSAGYDPALAASGAARMAALVVSNHGADLPRTAKAIWAEMMRG